MNHKNTSKFLATTHRKIIFSLQKNLSSQQKAHYDVSIIGGGAVGSTLAHLLSTHVPSLKVAVLDAKISRSVSDVLNTSSGNDYGNPTVYPSARAYALSPKSLSLLGNPILFKLEEAGRIAYYDSMQVWESDGPAVLKFNHDDVDKEGLWNNSHFPLDDDDDNKSLDRRLEDVLGAVVEDEILVSCLWEKIKESGRVDMISPVKILSVNAPYTDEDSQGDGHESKVKISFKRTHPSQAVNAVEETITTNLLVAADGANSFVRKSLGTFPTVSLAYGRQAVTCTVEIQESLKQTAFQRFQPNGPIALLPIWSDDPNKRGDASGSKMYANIVWSTTPEEAQQLMKIPDEVFTQRINDMLQCGPVNVPPLVSDEMKNSMPQPLQNAMNGLEMLSRSMNNGLTMSGLTERRLGFCVPPKITGIVGRRFSFDLNLMHAKNYTSPRVALVGDAAHTVHPMAGQGLNLGMGDVECLVNNLKQAVESGMGIGGMTGLQYALQQYESSRQRQVVATMGGIQFLHSVFATTFSPMVHARSMGMNIVNSAGPLRRKLVQVATGFEQVV
jgi:ubiquinone biosynthesis monooxygenase Coq6